MWNFIPIAIVEVTANASPIYLCYQSASAHQISQHKSMRDWTNSRHHWHTCLPASWQRRVEFSLLVLQRIYLICWAFELTLRKDVGFLGIRLMKVQGSKPAQIYRETSMSLVVAGERFSRISIVVVASQRGGSWDSFTPSFSGNFVVRMPVHRGNKNERRFDNDLVVIG